MRNKFPILLSVALLFFISNLNFAFAAHFILGAVNNSYDGEASDGHSVILWNPSNGISDNLTDVIGPMGNSGTSLYYLINCELLSSPCNIGDTLQIKVISSFNSYISSSVFVITTGNGVDYPQDIILNSFPSTNNTSPIDFFNTTSLEVNFTCSANDSDGNLHNVTLFGNWSGWHPEATKPISGTFSQANFSLSLLPGKYLWSCLASDDLGSSKFSPQNFTFTIDIPPNVSSVLVNSSKTCGTSDFVRVLCNVSAGTLPLSSVIVQAIHPSGIENHSSSFIIGPSYFSDIFASEIGNWTFRCYVNDTNNNLDSSFSPMLNASVQTIDLIADSQSIYFSKLNPIESETIQLISNITNQGCAKANNFTAEFYYGNPDLGGIKIGQSQISSLDGFNNMTINQSWNAMIGTSSLYVALDFINAINETNKSNNIANTTFNLTSWEDFFGNATGGRVLGGYNGENLTTWMDNSKVSGNIFVTDKESEINWFNLMPFGKNKSGQESLSDFSELDYILNTSDFSDSISNIFTSDGEHPRNTADFEVHGKNITDVPYINSTNNSNFYTGILWDTTKDTDEKYGRSDHEDVVFMANINPGRQGAFGNYDYEIKIPVRLRQYYSSEIKEVYLYYDLN